MARDLTQPDPAVVLDHLEAFRRSKVMFAGVSLGIFDALAAGPKPVESLAVELSANAASLRRLLDGCVCLQLLECHDGRYQNTPAATAYLTSTSATRLTGYLNYSNTVMWTLWAHLEDAVREGTHRWPQAYGWDGPIFSHFFKTEAAKREFLMGMHGFGTISSPQVVSAFDLSRFQTIADLGGATGHLAMAACQRYSHLRGIVFDLPDATALAREMVAASPVADRVDVVGGDFFTDPLPAADLMALGRILHDWSLPKIELLLGRIFAALPSGGGLLIAEKMLLENHSGPRWAILQDLNMLTCTEGQERSLSEYESLLVSAGFVNVTGCRTPAPIDAILALKP